MLCGAIEIRGDSEERVPRAHWRPGIDDRGTTVAAGETDAKDAEEVAT